MITLTGTYADECNGPLADRTLQYVCRVLTYKGRYYDGVGTELQIEHGDVLLACSDWFALFREKKSATSADPVPEPETDTTTHD